MPVQSGPGREIDVLISPRKNKKAVEFAVFSDDED
jgi:hypothetical protein